MPLRCRLEGNNLRSSVIGAFETAYFLYIPTLILGSLVSYRKSGQHSPGAGILHCVYEMQACGAAKISQRRILPMPDKLAVLQLAHSLPQFGVGIHHDRPIPGHRFFQRLA